MKNPTIYAGGDLIEKPRSMQDFGFGSSIKEFGRGLPKHLMLSFAVFS